MMYNWTWGDWMYGCGMGGFGFMLMIAFWALVILGIISLVKAVASRDVSSPKEDSSLDILKMSYPIH